MGSMSLGCSETTKKQPLGCRPENKKAIDYIAILKDTSEAIDSNLGGLQLTTSAMAKSCYCDSNKCNAGNLDQNLDQFKIAFSGYTATIIGIFGIVGNLVSFKILVQPAMRSSTNYILIGKIFHKQ